MAKQVSTVDSLIFLIDDRENGTTKSEIAKVLTDFSRKFVTIAGSAPEASFKPAEISSIDFLFVKPAGGTAGGSILLRTIAAGSQYQIPAGGIFYLFSNSAGVTDILITSNETFDVEVEIQVGEE